jgi:hypothetical protein
MGKDVAAGDDRLDQSDRGGAPRHCGELSNAGLTPADAELRLAFGRIDPTREMIITRVIKGHLQWRRYRRRPGPSHRRSCVTWRQLADARLPDKSAIDCLPEPIGDRTKGQRRQVLQSHRDQGHTDDEQDERGSVGAQGADGDDTRSLSCEGSGER